MKANKIIYWIATGLVVLMMLYSAYAYFTTEGIKQAFVHLGFPDYFRVELAIAKILGAIVLIAPVSGRIKEWAYAGFTINFVSAFIAHSASGDGMFERLTPVVVLVFLIVSYITYHNSRKTVMVA